MRKILTKKFFERSALKVGPDLLGKYLCVNLPAPLLRKEGIKESCFMITEVEAYEGFNDKASHASRGKTLRNAPMFGEAGRWYVYFTYGMHWMLNIVTGKKDYPAAVLIRGIEGFKGPAKLTKFLKIDKRFNTKKAEQKTGLWIEDRGIKIKKSQIKRAPRIGVDYAEGWKDKKYRFLIDY